MSFTKQADSTYLTSKSDAYYRAEKLVKCGISLQLLILKTSCLKYRREKSYVAIAYDDYAAELFGEFAYLNCAHRPEITVWLTQTRLF